MKMLCDWFPITIFDWEEIQLIMGETFYRLEHVHDYFTIHYRDDELMSTIVHGALLAALYDGIDLKTRPECPMMLVGRKVIKRGGKLMASEHQCTTSEVRELFFTDYGPAVRTQTGSEYLLVGEDQSWRMLWYLEGQPERPDMIDRFFTIV